LYFIKYLDPVFVKNSDNKENTLDVKPPTSIPASNIGGIDVTFKYLKYGFLFKKLVLSKYKVSNTFCVSLI
jgi:hypothetical protein